MLACVLALAAALGCALGSTGARHPPVRCGAAADLIYQHTGCSEEEARKAELRLCGRSLNAIRCAEVCKGLRERLQLRDCDLRKIALRSPALLSLDFDCKIRPTLDGLQHRMGLNDDELTTIVVRLPPVLGYSYASNVHPKLDALQSRLQMSIDELKKVVVAQPSVRRSILPRMPRAHRLHPAMVPLQILGLSLQKNIEPKLDFIQGVYTLVLFW